MNPPSSTSKKRITQQTFDETVRENIEEFELNREDAVEDAIKQFTTQGVDLSNICISHNECDDHWLEEVASQIDALASIVEDGSYKDGGLPSSFDRQAVLNGLRGLQAFASDKDGEKTINAKKIMASMQTINLVAKLWASDDKELLLQAMETAQTICSGGAEDENRDQLWVLGMTKLCKAGAAHENDAVFLTVFMRTIKCFCTKSEDNKVYFVRAGGLDIFINALQKYQDNRDLICETCLAMKAVTAVDDLRKDFSSAHNHTRQLVSKGAIPLLINVVKSYQNDLDIVAAALSAVKNLATNDESVGQIAKEGGLEITTSALETHLNNPVMARTAVSVFRNVSADDKYKTTLCKNGGAELMMKAMRKHIEDPKLQDHGLATLGAMALRSPDNCIQLVGLGVIPVVLRAMQSHAEISTIQRQGCLAIRNLVCRNPEVIDHFLEADAEAIVRQAGKFQESVDEAYAALRDLNVEVKRLVVDPSTGKVKDAVDQFGKGSNKGFRQVFEASNDLEKAVDAAVSAPSESYRF